MESSVVVTGGGGGIGRAIVERLAGGGTHVTVIERDGDQLAWVPTSPAAPLVSAVIGSADAPEVTDEAAADAERHAPLTGWVNNAAVFRDASVDSTDAPAMVHLISLNLALAVTGCTTAVRHLLAHDRAGAIVNVSSHQARQAVPGSTPYATAKAGIEGLTRALAVEYGARGIRVNALAPGSVWTERYGSFLAGLPHAARQEVEATMARVHPLGRVARAEEVAAAVAYLLGPDASFVSGATLPVDGGRTVLAHEPPGA